MRVFVDMDGVLADFEAKKRKHFSNSGLDIFEDPFNCHKEHEKIFWATIREKYPDWFLELPVCPGAKKLMEYLRPYNPVILTAIPRLEMEVWRVVYQKQEWGYRYFPNVPMICCLTRHKKDYAIPQSVLIDDRENTIDSWIKKGGSGILHRSIEDTLSAFKVVENAVAMAGEQ